MVWNIDLSDEVAAWYVGLNDKRRAQADRAFDRLADGGHNLRMPYSRSLGDGVFELRFQCGDVAQRVTYVFEHPNVITLTAFRKQRNNESREVGRAKRAAQRRKDGQ